MRTYSANTELLTKGKKVKNLDFNDPQVFPYFPTTTFRTHTLSEALDAPFSYVRMNNPDTEALGDVVTFLEKGEESLIFASGMGAIATTLMAMLKPGDEALFNQYLYGETYVVFTDILPRFGVKTKAVNFDDMDCVRAAMSPDTKLLYTEVLANPVLHVADIPTLSAIAHAADALLMIDNTFTSAINIRPLTLGADIVISSMTKFMNGHSDAIGGCVTSTSEIIKKVYHVRIHIGTSGDPFTSFTMLKNFGTMDLRVRRQCASALKLAKALEANPLVPHVNHPGLESFPQHSLAMELFESEDAITGMLSFILPEDVKKVDAFISNLHIAYYAGSLGGLHTTLMHPVTTSHCDVPDDARRRMGITPGLMRVSVGIEDVDDLIDDFQQALEAMAKI